MTDDGRFDAVFESPVGHLGIRMQGEALAQLVFLTRRRRLKPPASNAAATVLDSIRNYFEDPLQGPDVVLQMSGTVFQRQVWQALRAIPVGKVSSYGALARRLGSSARAVGNACRNNPVPIVVPCHRVVSHSGLGGFAGQTGGRLVAIKQQLLVHEGVEI